MLDGRFVYLTTAAGTFHGRVIAARLGADGIVCDLRGAVDGPYPLPGTVDIYVPAQDEPLARELLLGDQVDAAFEPPVTAERAERIAAAEHGGSPAEHGGLAAEHGGSPAVRTPPARTRPRGPARRPLPQGGLTETRRLRSTRYHWCTAASRSHASRSHASRLHSSRLHSSRLHRGASILVTGIVMLVLIFLAIAGTMRLLAGS